MGNCCCVLRTDQENIGLSGQHSVERRQSSIENRLQSSAEKEQCCSEERLLSGNSNGQSSLSEIGQNEQLSDDRMHTPKPTRNVRKNTPPSEKWNKFMDEFRIAAEGVELKSRMYPTNPSIRDRKSGKIYQLQVHVLFTYTYTDGSRTAAVVELRNVEKLYSNHISIDRLCSARNALLENGCHKVYAYLYVKEGATVSGPLKIKAEVQDIKIVKKDEMSQTQLVLEIDETLQLAPDPKTKSGATKCLIDFKSLEDTDSASVPDHSATELMHLRDSHHTKIYAVLKDHAADWRDIGSALGFSEGELNNIQSDQNLLTQSPPMSFLRKMLSQWLQWTPGDGRGSEGYATRESLVAALLKANLGQLAEKIKHLNLQ